MNDRKKPDKLYTIMSVIFIVIAIIGFGYKIFTGEELGTEPFYPFIVGLLYMILAKL